MKLKKLLASLSAATIALTSIGVSALAEGSDFYKSDNDGYWHITTFAGLKAFRDSINNDKTSYKNQTISIDADIDMTEAWTPINAYQNSSALSGATINGNNHTISKMTVSVQEKDEGYDYGVGFISQQAGNLKITNLTFDDCTVNSPSGSQVGIVVGMSYGRLEFDNVDIKDSKVTACTKAGAYVGQNDDGNPSGSFKDCDLINTVVEANYSSALFMGLVNINAASSIFDDECSADSNSKFEWITCAKEFTDRGVLINDRYYAISGTNLWLTDPCGAWAEQRVTDAKLTYDNDEYNAKGTVFVDPVASVSGINYLTLAKAFDVATDGQTIKLLNDTSIDGIYIDKNLSLTLNTNGKTITVCETTHGLSLYSGSLTIDGNGTFISPNSETSDNSCLISNCGGDLIINNGTFTCANFCIGAYDSNATITINNAVVNAKAGGACIYIVEGLANIYGLKFYGDKDDRDGSGCVWAGGKGTLSESIVNIYGGSYYTAPILNIQNEKEILGSNYCLYDYHDVVDCGYTKGTINVYGGTFADFDPSGVENAAGTSNANYSYVHESCTVTKNNDGTWTVGAKATEVAKVGETKYTSVADAVADAITNSSTVVLSADAKDVDLSTVIDSFSLNTNGKKLELSEGVLKKDGEKYQYKENASTVGTYFEFEGSTYNQMDVTTYESSVAKPTKVKITATKGEVEKSVIQDLADIPSEIDAKLLFNYIITGIPTGVTVVTALE